MTDMGPERIEFIRDGVRKREATPDSQRIRGIERIEVQREEGLRYRAREVHGSDASMVVDEPPDRGGSGEGNSPLGHFLTGTGSCLLNQFVRIAIAEGYDLRFIRADVRGEFARNPGGAFERITTEVRAEGTLAESEAARLTERAEALCYVHNTLSRALRMTTVLYLNGEEAVRRVSQPA
jgi:uncharacterized OsmC-like protein